MGEENKYMDDSFKKMSEEFNVSYDKSFWDQAKVTLENDALDGAFKDAAAQMTAASSGMVFPTESLGDAFLDEAFKDAAAETSVAYDSSFFAEMEANKADLEMNDAFSSAAKHLKASYNPAFWGDADLALQEEGLHYEYNSAYWNEARNLLDKEDRKLFFFKWTAIAAVLLLISAFGINSSLTTPIFTQNHKSSVTLGNGDRIHNNYQNIETSVAQNELIAEANERLDGTVNRNSSAEILRTTSNDLIHQNEPLTASSNVINDRTAEEVINSLNELEVIVALNDEDENSIRSDRERERIEANADGQNHLSENVLNLNPMSITQDDNDPMPIFYKNLGNEYVDITSIVFDPLAELDTDNDDIRNLDRIEIETMKLKTRHAFGITAGAGFGNNYGASKNLLSERYYAGAEYLIKGKGFLRNFEFGLNAGLNLSRHDNFKLENLTYDPLLNGLTNRRARFYVFRDILYSSFNGLVNYRITRRHKIKFGVGVDSYMGVQYNYAKTFNSEAEIENDLRKNLVGPFEEYDLKFSLGYEFQVTPRLGIQLNSTFGTVDRSINGLSKQLPVLDRELNVTAGIKYNIFTNL